jgi:hypothetical protein
MSMKTRDRREAGQIIVITPILILLMLAAILLAVNVSILSRERIKLQVASDAAAHAGARVQSSNLNWIALLNDGILVADAVISTGLALVAVGTPLCVFGIGCAMVEKGLELIEKGRDAGGALRTVQEGIMVANYFMVPAEIKRVAIGNGASFAVPSPFGIALDLKAGPDWLPDPPFIKLKIRKHDKIKEKIHLVATKRGGRAVFGSSLLRGLGRGKASDLDYPTLVAASAARPYYHGWGHEPRKKKVDSFLSMVNPFPTWNAKLESIW